MAGGPSPNSTSPGAVTGPFVPGTLGPPSSSPSKQPYTTPQTMATDVSAVNGIAPHGFNLSPISERKPLDLSFGKLEPAVSNPDKEPPSILIRKLPRTYNIENLRAMLLFAKDMIDVHFIEPDFPEDAGYHYAVARFMTLAGAHEAKERLHGKEITNVKLAVELIPSAATYPV